MDQEQPCLCNLNLYRKLQMCRLLGYLGQSISLDQILYKPEHSLVVQSYQPKEMTAGVVNADGLGIGWYHSQKSVNPFTYKNTLPIWNDTNLPELSRYVESGCVLAYVRSATVGQALDFNNCQPFQDDSLLFIHNGFIKDFRQTLYKPIRDRLLEQVYQLINGTTDSEHIFALLVNQLRSIPNNSIEDALQTTLMTLTELALSAQVSFSANLIISDGQRLIASRYAHDTSNPTLYWLQDDANYPDAVIIASEPLFEGNWKSIAENSIVTVEENLEVCLQQIIG